MTDFINYLIESNLSLLCWICVYFILFKHETNFSIIRIIMLAGLVTSVVFPLAHLTPANHDNFLPSLSNVMPSYWLPAIQVDNGVASIEEVPASFDLFLMMTWIYVFGVITMSLLFLTRVARILLMISKGKVVLHLAGKVMQLTGNRSTFSFFKFIFLSDLQELSQEEKEQVIRHEEVHVKQWHSLDILLLNFLKIIFWFNPIIWVYEKVFVQLHEFEADARSAESQDVNRYCNLLARVALQSAGLSLGNHFNNSLTIKRIQMMRTIKSRIKIWKVAASASIVCIMFFFIACQDQVNETTLKEGELESEVQERFDQFKKEFPGENYIVEYNKDGDKKLAELESKYGQAKHIENFTITTEDGKVKEFSMIQYARDGETRNGEEIFSIVEQMPEFPGGMPALLDFFAKNLKCPVETTENGTVFTQFVINKDGFVSDVKVIKGVSPALDSEAERVTKLLPKWRPGAQNGRNVRTRFVLPINFSPKKAKAEAEAVEESPLQMEIIWKISQDGGQRFAEGKVNDENGNPLPNANILLNGTTQGVNVDMNGNFKIKLPERGSGRLSVSFVGYKTQVLSF